MLAIKEDILKEIQDEVDTNFQQYKSDREDIDDLMNIADYMYAAAQNRTLNSSEKTKGANLEKDPRANVGSTIFHRQVNQLASQLVNVINSQPDLVRYKTISNQLDMNSAQDGKEIAEQMQVLSRWTRRKDQFDLKIPEFGVNVFKKSTVFVMMAWKYCNKTLKRKAPVAKATPKDDGTVDVKIAERVVSTKVNMGYPTFKILDPKQVFADRWIPCIEEQNCVVVTEMVNRSYIANMVNEGEYDKDQYAKLDETFVWDKSDETDVEEESAYNRDLERSVSTPKMYRKYNVFIRLQMKDGKLDPEADPELYYLVIIGNSPKNGLVMQVSPISDYDPDGEIPIRVINALPDKPFELYHTSQAGVIRSGYSVDCTLLNQMVDNNSLVNDPPKTIIDGAHRVKSWEWRPGAEYHVDEHGVMQPVQIRDVTQGTAILRQGIQSEMKQALATDAPMMGEYAGARTSATEFMGVNQNTKQPHLVQINYILQQFLPWWGRKIMSYWMYHGDPDVILQITDMQKTFQIAAPDSHVEFDVEVNIVQEYENDLLRQQQMGNIMQIIGSSPFFQQSEHHSINPANLLKKWLNSMNWEPSEIIDVPMGVDAEANAQYIVNTMLQTGVYQRPDPATNLAVHLRVARGEEIRWRGLEASSDPRARNIALLQQYIAEATQMMTQKSLGSQQLPGGTANQTQGEAAGNEIAGELGAQVPQ